MCNQNIYLAKERSPYYVYMNGLNPTTRATAYQPAVSQNDDNNAHQTAYTSTACIVFFLTVFIVGFLYKKRTVLFRRESNTTKVFYTKSQNPDNMDTTNSFNNSNIVNNNVTIILINTPSNNQINDNTSGLTTKTAGLLGEYTSIIQPLLANVSSLVESNVQAMVNSVIYNAGSLSFYNDGGDQLLPGSDMILKEEDEDAISTSDMIEQLPKALKASDLYLIEKIGIILKYSLIFFCLWIAK
jgi:hypothetical protein